VFCESRSKEAKIANRKKLHRFKSTRAGCFSGELMALASSVLDPDSLILNLGTAF
jgi:hypothetical protein